MGNPIPNRHNEAKEDNGENYPLEGAFTWIVKIGLQVNEFYRFWNKFIIDATLI